MMPVINIHPHASEAEAEAFRLTLKDADKFGLYCCHDGKSAMWSVIPKIALELIFNAETALPVTERTWVGIEKKDMPVDPDPMYDHKYFIAGMVYADRVLKEKNT
jgi:hypothetical protein